MLTGFVEFGQQAFSPQNWLSVSITLSVFDETPSVGLLSLFPASATAGGLNKFGVAFTEGRIFEDKQDILLNPELKIADGKQDAPGLTAAAPAVFFETGGKGLLLLVGLQLAWLRR